ncbi:hypothetical protein SDC9_190309 [bioreactor metagenome]|uniref:Uncharacterized protein n=1 Tax=bioreactor metagenome TaxID=1076179 RepID=A0A645HWB5_9ZZZZ
MGTIIFVLQLVAGQNSFGGIDNHNMIATINIGRKNRLMLAAQNAGNGCSGTAQRLACGVNDIPLALDAICLRKKG